MKSSKTIKSAYDSQIKQQTRIKKYGTSSQITPAKSFSYNSKAAESIQGLNESKYSYDEVPISTHNNNSKYAIDTIPNQTIMKKSAFNSYFSQLQDENNKIGADTVQNTQEKMRLSTISKILNPYVAQREDKRKKRIFQVMEEFYKKRIRQSFYNIKRPMQYLRTVLKSPTFSKRDIDTNTEDLIKKMRSFVVGKITKQKINSLAVSQDHSDNSLSQFVKDFDQNSDNLIKVSAFSQQKEIDPKFRAPMINKLIISETPRLIYQMYEKQFPQAEKNRTTNIQNSYKKTFSIINSQKIKH